MEDLNVSIDMMVLIACIIGAALGVWLGIIIGNWLWGDK